jgi:tricarballylate dehydrogenase
MNSYDVVVVGAGNAGLTAAIVAKEAGRSVLLLEASERSERGGNSRWASGVFRIVHNGIEDIRALVGEDVGIPWDRVEVDPYSDERFFSDLMRSTGGQVNQDLLRQVIRRSAELARWLKDRGVKWSLSSSKFMNVENMEPGQTIKLPPGGELIIDGNGVHLVDTLFDFAESIGVDIWYETQAMKLATKGLSVSGLDVVTPDEHRHVDASTVILASGSFEASAEARLRYLGPGWDLVKVRGTRHNTGRMLDEAISIGALSSGHWSGVHSVAIDADSPDFGDLSIGDQNARYSYPYSLMVNLDGKRFLDEGEDEMNFTYAEVGAKLLGQPQVTAYQVFDQKTVGLTEPRYQTGTPVIADSIEELAEKTGMSVKGLEETVSLFNAACGTGDFDPYSKDGLSAFPEGQPAKSNWALPLDSGPYVAYKVTCGITFTFAGLGIDEHSRVLSTAGKPMRGLYACGEIAGGIISHNLPGGSGLTKGGVTAVFAGETAAAEAKG